MNESNDPYERLAQAIVVNTVKEWRDAKRKLKTHPRNSTAQRQLFDCERFFRSGWFTELSGLDGETILERLEEEQ